jgi:hypothetical protein
MQVLAAGPPARTEAVEKAPEVAGARDEHVIVERYSGY